MNLFFLVTIHEHRQQVYCMSQKIFKYTFFLFSFLKLFLTTYSSLFFLRPKYTLIVFLHISAAPCKLSISEDEYNGTIARTKYGTFSDIISLQLSVFDQMERSISSAQILPVHDAKVEQVIVLISVHMGVVHYFFIFI